jgi:predicted DNA-binding transcriptional regulator AlpA
MNNIIVMPLADLRTVMQEVLREELLAFGEKKTQAQVLTAKEVCLLFKISSVTLWKWIKSGRITPLKRTHLKSKLLFNYAEVTLLSETKKRYARL